MCIGDDVAEFASNDAGDFKNMPDTWQPQDTPHQRAPHTAAKQRSVP
jgi:hypothetical protein